MSLVARLTLGPRRSSPPIWGVHLFARPSHTDAFCSLGQWISKAANPLATLAQLSSPKTVVFEAPFEETRVWSPPAVIGRRQSAHCSCDSHRPCVETQNYH